MLRIAQHSMHVCATHSCAHQLYHTTASTTCASSTSTRSHSSSGSSFTTTSTDGTNSTNSLAIPTAPRALMGCWRRNWIRFSTNINRKKEHHVSVIWLQTASGMGDLRIDPNQPLTETDSSCGITVVDESTTPYMTADWLNGETGFAQQAVSSFPEKGWLDWGCYSDGVMYERAPSGAYVEEWEKLPDCGPIVEHYTCTYTPNTVSHTSRSASAGGKACESDSVKGVASPTARRVNCYIAGVHHFLAVERGPGKQLHEFSYGVRSPDGTVMVELSTVPECVGQPMHAVSSLKSTCLGPWVLVSQCIVSDAERGLIQAKGAGGGVKGECDSGGSYCS